MKKFLLVLFILFLSGCIEAGEFTPERHALHSVGHPDCDQTPEKCVEGVPW